MKIIIFKEKDTGESGVGGFRIGAVDIPDNTPAASIPDTSMRLFTQQAGGSIADGMYWQVKASEANRRSSKATTSSKISAESNLV